MLKASGEEHLSFQTQVNLTIARFSVILMRPETVILASAPKCGSAMIFKKHMEPTFNKTESHRKRLVLFQPL